MLTMGLREHVRGWARTRSDESAYVWDDSRITWRDFDALIDSISARLSGYGLDRADRVLVLLPDGAGVHAAFHGCEGAGLVAVGVGWRAGEAEIAHLVAKTGARAAVLPSETRVGPGHEVLNRLGLDAGVFLDDLEGRPVVDDGPTARSPHEPIGPAELWLLNSTSGTTGLPKCVMQTQNRWAYFHSLAMRHGRLGQGETWMSVVPAPFGFGLWTAHVSPTIEGRNCVVQSRFDAAAALDLIERERVTVLCAVSSQLAMLAEAHSDQDLTSLQVTFSGGEAISRARATTFEELTGCRILNFYGSNETGVLSGTTYDDPPERRLTTAGRVIREMNVRLYDFDGQRIEGDVGRGRPGCRGPALSLGYWQDEAGNAELFTEAGWMMMGDIVTIDADGWLSVVGRTSDFIIRGGKNISSAAVEEEVSSQHAVALAAVVGVPDDRVGERVAAVVELHPGAELDLEALKAHLDQRGVSREWWPEYLFTLDELPRSSGGKIAKGEVRDLASELSRKPR